MKQYKAVILKNHNLISKDFYDGSMPNHLVMRPEIYFRDNSNGFRFRDTVTYSQDAILVKGNKYNSFNKLRGGVPFENPVDLVKSLSTLLKNTEIYSSKNSEETQHLNSKKIPKILKDFAKKSNLEIYILKPYDKKKTKKILSESV